MTKLITTMSTILISALVLTGCAGGDADSKSSSAKDTNSQETLNDSLNNSNEKQEEKENKTIQEEVKELGQEIMPFSLGESKHYFVKTKTGGVQTVIVFDLEQTDEIQKIREHLQEIALEFQQGNYANSAYIHGKDMPGLQTLSTNPNKIVITYNENPAGGYITYESEEPEIIQAVHDWFDAQVHDHGDDASSSIDMDSLPGNFGENHIMSE
jgi:cell division protein FtsB